MSTTTTSFYVTGGTLRYDAPSYVARQADTDLYDGLSRGEFCYILTARQMGKSSLMARTAARLRDEGVAVVVLDLTALGQNVTAEQWYDGLRDAVAAQLGLEDELDDYWQDQARFGPLQRWMKGLREVVLPHLADQRPMTNDQQRGEQTLVVRRLTRPNRDARLVIFIDEIDTVQSLPFSTDELFAGIRECYNRRTEDPELARLTFCLLGVASPSDLIRDTRLTPFNIGRRIELTDFTEREAAPLAEGLHYPSPCPLPETERGSALAQTEEGLPPTKVTTPSPSRRGGRGRGNAHQLLQRILYWTGGHPYLTQRLCRAIVEATATNSQPGTARSGVIRNSQSVDRLCGDLFLSPRAHERDDNLLFVREQLLQGSMPRLGGGADDSGVEADIASLLDLYAQVRRGQRVRDDETDPLVSLLRLSGITRVVDRCLRVRNRIYARVFDREWITTHMPDAELRRQRAAYRRGMLRATAIAAVIVAVIAGLALAALSQARRADRVSRLEARQRGLAEEREQTARRYLYAAQMSVAKQAWEVGDVTRALNLLAAQRPVGGQEDLRGFEWRYLWRLCRRGDALFTLRGHKDEVHSVAFSPDGRLLASGSSDHTVKLWDVAARRVRITLKGYTRGVGPMAFSPDGKWLALGSADRTVKLWEIPSGRELTPLTGHQDAIWCLAFSPDGKILATGSGDKTVRLWVLPSGRPLGALRGHKYGIDSVAFSPDGRTLATGSDDETAKLWDVATGRELASLPDIAFVNSVAFSPDGKILATGVNDDSVKLWDVRTKPKGGGRKVTLLQTLRGHTNSVFAVAFSPDGNTLATSGADGTVRLWDVAARQERAILRGHTGRIFSVAFSPDGKTLATGSEDHTVRLWPARPAPEGDRLQGHTDWVTDLALSPNGKLLATASKDHTMKLWDIASRRAVATLKGHTNEVWCVAFSPDGKTLATGSGIWYEPGAPGELILWDVARKRAVTTLARSKQGIHSVGFSPDGRILALGDGDHTVRLWDVGARREIAGLTGHTGRADCLAFSPDGKLLATGSWDQTVRLWDVASRRAVAPLKGHKAPVSGVAFSPNGKLLATGSYDGITKLWDVATRREVATLESAGNPVAFSPDGKTLATSSPGHGVKLWEVATQQEVMTLKGPTSFLQSVAFSSDGEILAAGSADAMVRLWRAAPFSETDAPASARRRSR